MFRDELGEIEGKRLRRGEKRGVQKFFLRIFEATARSELEEIYRIRSFDVEILQLEPLESTSSF